LILQKKLKVNLTPIRLSFLSAEMSSIVIESGRFSRLLLLAASEKLRAIFDSSNALVSI